MQKRILIIRRRYTKTSIGNGRSSTNIDDDFGNWHIEKLYAQTVNYSSIREQR